MFLHANKAIFFHESRDFYDPSVEWAKNNLIDQRMMSTHPQLDFLHRLWARGRDFLKSRTAILGGAMTWVSDHQLVSCLSQAGGFGVLAGGALSAKDLEKQILWTQEKTDQPFGVNVILFHPELNELLSVCRQHQVTHVFLGGGMPSKQVIDVVLDYGGHPVGFAPSVAVGRRLIKSGIAALVIEGSEAGGHVGPVSTSVLVQEILPILSKEVPIFVAGGIGDGKTILSYLLMGAAGCQLGTRFSCSTESPAHPKFKEAFIKAHAREAILSVQLDPTFPIIPVRALNNQGMKDFMTLQKTVIDAYHAGQICQKEARMKIEFFWSGALKRAVLEGDVDNGSLMAGQSVGLVTAIEPCQVIIDSLVLQILDGLSDIHRMLKDSA